jgi:peptide/nickel transport system substrate-binding protein
MAHRPGRFAATLGAALLAAGCGEVGSAPEPARAPAPAVVTVGTTVDLAGVNELISGGVRFTNELLDQLFLSLLAEQPDWAEHPPTLAPSLAEGWQLAADGRELVFRLRGDARWSDGTPVTAEDVRFTWRAQLAPEIAWAYAQSKEAIEAVEIVDARTVRFRFRHAYPYQVVDANDGRILPAHAWSALPFESWRRSEPWFRERLVTSGPFRLAAWKPGQEIVLEPAPERAGEARPGLDRVVFRVVPDAAALVERLLAGEIDFFDGLTPRDAARVEASPRLRLAVSDARQFDYIAWNQRRPPFDDAEIRLALTLGIDRQALVDALWHGYARVAAGPVPAGVWARDPDLAPWPYDPQRAREILARRGFRDADGDGLLERDGKPLAFELTTNSANRLRVEAAVLIRDQLRRVGVAVQPRLIEMNALGDVMRSGGFDALLGGWAIDTTLDFRPYFHSASIGDDGWNTIAYRNPEVDRLLDEVRAEPDLESARPRLVRVQRILHAEQPYTFLWEPRRLAAVARDLEGVEVSHLSAFGTLARWSRRPARE